MMCYFHADTESKTVTFSTSCVAPLLSRLYADRIAATAGNEGAVV